MRLVATKVEKVCDIDAAGDAKTYRLSAVDNGDVYEIDLCVKHADTATMAKVREKGRKVVDAATNIGDAATRALIGKMRNRP